MLEWLRRWFGRGNDISSEGVATAGTVNSMSGRAQTVVQAGVIGNLTVGPDDRSLLREITEANLSTLSGHAGLPGSHDGVRVRRAELDMLLATGGDFVITGEPGCGKSGLLAVIAEHLVENAETVVVLSVDTLGSRVGVARGDVSLSRPLSAVLKDWEGEGRATLLLDGLDAARGEPLTWLADVVRDLQGSRWRTIATMRSFDLRRSRTWSMVFSGAPVSEGADHRDGELLKVRHFRLGDLSEAELAWLAAARPDIGALIAGADGPLLDLIRNPFNLRLACELLDEGVEQATLVNARDQLDLLQRYWQARVDHRPDGEARKRVLNRVSRAMLDRRTLRAGMDVVPDSLLDACAALVHDGVLDELRARLKASGGAQLVYSHHILFDFAIAALVLTAADRSNLVDVLDGDPNLVFVIRPSIDLHLADLWHANDTRATFADVARSLAAADHSLAGIAAARVVVAEAREDGDVLWIAGEEDQDSGFEITAGWVAGVMDAADDPMRAWVRVNSRPWATLAARMMARLEHSFQPVVVEQVYRLLVQLDKIGAVATDETAAPVWADCVARLMSLALDEPIERERLAEAVSRFLPRAVAIAPRHVGVLRRTLDPRLMVLWHSNYLMRYVDGIDAIATADPELAADLLLKIMLFEENRDDVTPMTSGVFSLTSTRRQDFEGVKHLIGPRMTAFISKAGTLAAVPVLLASLRRRNTGLPDGLPGYPLHVRDLQGQVDLYAPDLRYGPGHGVAHTILTAFAKQLEVSQTTDWEPLVDRLVADLTHPAAWMHLLHGAARAPETSGRAFVPTLLPGGLLVHHQTRAAAGQLIRAVHPILSDEDRGALEAAIVQAPLLFAHDQSDERTELLLDQLAGCLDPAKIRNPDLAARAQRLAQQPGGIDIPEPEETELGFVPATPRDDLGPATYDRLTTDERAIVDDLIPAVQSTTNDGTPEQLKVLEEALRHALLANLLLNHPGLADHVLRGIDNLARHSHLDPDSDVAKIALPLLLNTIRLDEGESEGDAS